MAILPWVFGCQEKVRRAPPKKLNTSAAAEAITNQNLEEAFGHLDTLDEFNQETVKHEILGKINRWIFTTQFDDAWKIDPLVKQLPKEVRDSYRLKDLDTSALRDYELRYEMNDQEFTAYRGGDYDYLQGVFWSSRIAKDVTKNGVADPELIAWINTAHPKLPVNEKDDLITASLLFDWSVRSIQLHKVPGVVTPGTTRDTWECLQLGYGDHVQRSRVFISLARQRGITVLMLEVPDANDKLVTYTPAALIGKQLFVFDALYGLPISTATGTGIATLKEIISEPEVLASMNSEKYKYPLSSAGFAKASMLIDAPSTALMQATAMIDKALSGDNKVFMHLRPSEIVDKLKERSNVVDVRLWEVPYLAEDSVRLRLSDSNLISEFVFERQISDIESPYGIARMLHLMCRFDQNLQRNGARQMYLLSRKMDRDMAQLTRTQQIEQLELQGVPLQGTPQQIDDYLQRMISSTKMFKELSSYQLGLIALQSSEFDSAIDYFSVRVLKEFPESVFRSSTHYNLGRAYMAKAQGEETEKYLALAIEQLTHEDDLVSPQRRGNTLLAERLGK
ncbi:MAG: hypothetical protein COA78_37735 [Blastopirellula sp.]|nr:MAG: hypothetical protein COA78_37735 [Blastopirellula sp.]